MKREDILTALNNEVNGVWEKIKRGPFWRHMLTYGLDRELYRILMTQIYFYTRHNAINQAVAAYKALPDNVPLLRFVFKHAQEELGHQYMVVHDLESIGLTPPNENAEEPLPATTALIAYLYNVALEKGPVARLGYSFWAESVYDHISDLLNHMRKDLQLKDKNMTFFVSHAVIDTKHSQEVNEMIKANVETYADRASILEVARTSLFLTGMMLDQSYEHYLEHKKTAAA